MTVINPNNTDNDSLIVLFDERACVKFHSSQNLSAKAKSAGTQNRHSSALSQKRLISQSKKSLTPPKFDTFKPKQRNLYPLNNNSSPLQLMFLFRWQEEQISNVLFLPFGIIAPRQELKFSLAAIHHCHQQTNYSETMLFRWCDFMRLRSSLHHFEFLISWKSGLFWKPSFTFKAFSASRTWAVLHLGFI